jgi:hypothetical protein
MGLVFRKSFKLPGGFRVNLSKSGIGVSAGVPGFRVGVGPSGGRVSLGIPGTGIGWVQSFGLGAGRAEHTPRPSLPSADGTQEVARYEARIASLVSAHRSSWRAWDWAVVAATPAPPGNAEHERWAWFNRVARGILAGDVEACETALHYLGPFADLHELGSTLNTAVTAPWCVEAWLAAHTPDVIPSEQVSLTPTGKVSTKKLSPTRYWALYQDHIASAAFRIGREVFALLPIPVVLVHVAVPLLDTSTGHSESTPILSVAFDRASFLGLNFDAIDPSDALAGFEHNMAFKKTTGFTPVTLLDHSEFEVT